MRDKTPQTERDVMHKRARRVKSDMNVKKGTRDTHVHVYAYDCSLANHDAH